jgi:pSer/pThr/pTyr-binding forkhead associated (FHA) protein
MDAGRGTEHEDTLARRPGSEETLTGHRAPGDLSQSEREALLSEARERVEQPGEYLVYEESGEWRTVGLTREWTRIGRSLAADVRFDDPTVSRRHALIVRQPDGVRVLDDRSLNGVFVNGARIEGKTLKDGDEILVGRYRLSFLSLAS